jgi:dipeptidyl-peptidase-4
VSSSEVSPPIADRYRRALERTAPKEAATTPGTAVEGYWLDEHRFYFLSESLLPSLGALIRTPCIADSNSHNVREVIPLERLASLVAEHSGIAAGVEMLASAEFDMSERDVLRISAGGQDYRVDTHRQCLLEVKASLGVPALYSPDGHYACFVKGNDLWLRDLRSGAERALTRDGATNSFYGQQSQTNLAALSYRRWPQPEGLWSPDSQWFLTVHIDERAVPEQALIQHAPPEGRPVLYQYKYPMPGDPLPIAVFVAIEVSSGRIARFDEFPTPITSFSPFQLRRAWFDDVGNAWFLRQDRYCRRAELIALDLARGTGRIVVQDEVSSGYLDFNPLMMATPNVRTLAGSQEVIWYSERDGWGHLYLHDASTGRLKNQITHGEWLVRDIVHVDESQRTVLLLAGGVDPNVDPARRSLCRVDLDGTRFDVLLTHDGDLCVPITGPGGLSQDRPGRPRGAQAGISPSALRCVVRFTSVDRGNSTEIVDLRSQQSLAIASALPRSNETAPRPFVSLAADGVTRLHGCLFLPPHFDASQRYPLIDYIYPGPQAAYQPQSFQAVTSAFARTLAELGFITLMLDTRSLPISSRAFHQIGYGNLLEPQLADHAAVVRDLCETLPFIDDRRIGVIGQSAGGAAAARALFDYGTIFKVGVSVCGNHDSSQYAAIWADKYCGPDGSSELVNQSNGLAAHKLRGKLLLVAGDMDENVQVSQTLSLVDALIRTNRNFDLVVVPNAGHGVLMTHGYAQRRVWDYLVRELLGEEPPTEFEIKFEPHELECFQRRCVQELR